MIIFYFLLNLAPHVGFPYLGGALLYSLLDLFLILLHIFKQILDCWPDFFLSTSKIFSDFVVESNKKSCW